MENTGFVANNLRLIGIPQMIFMSYHKDHNNVYVKALKSQYWY